MFFNFLNSSKKNKSPNFAVVKEDLLRIANVLNGQVDAIVFFENKKPKEILYDQYTLNYILSAYKVASEKWGEIEGPKIFLFSYLFYASSKFEVDKPEAMELLRRLDRDKEKFAEAIISGGVDGIEALKGGAPFSLSQHFVRNLDKLTNENMAKYESYREAETDKFIVRMNKFPLSDFR